MNWLQKISNYFESGHDWGDGPYFTLGDKLLELFKTEYVIGELKRRAYINHRLQYNKRYIHWLFKLEKHAWSLASEDVGPEILEYLQEWMRFHNGNGFAEIIADEDENSCIDDNGLLVLGSNFRYPLKEKIIDYFLKQHPDFVRMFMEEEIESSRQDQEYEFNEDMTSWNFQEQIEYISTFIQDIGYTFPELRKWLGQWGFNSALFDVLREIVYPAWRRYWGNKLTVAEKNVNEAIERLNNALHGYNLGNLLVSINLALNVQHVHGKMYEHMPVDDEILEELSDLDTDELDKFADMITRKEWITASL